MNKKVAMLILIVMIIVSPLTKVQAQTSATRQSIAELPFSGYYIATEDYAVEGLLFEDNQLYIYLNDDSHSSELEGHEWVHFLEEFHSFPHPDLKSYTNSVRDRYLEEYDMAYDLQAEYQEITELITPEMGQQDVQNLINNRIPGIYYTEKNDYKYYTIASPMVTNEGDDWHVSLFGEALYTFSIAEDETLIRDQAGIEYEYIPGIKP